MLISSMAKARFLRIQFTKGFRLVEVLVILVSTATALLGVVELQNRNQIANLEAAQYRYPHKNRRHRLPNSRRNN